METEPNSGVYDAYIISFKDENFPWQDLQGSWLITANLFADNFCSIPTPEISTNKFDEIKNKRKGAKGYFL